MATILDQISKVFLVHQQQALCDTCVQFHWLQCKQSWETCDYIQASPTAKCTFLNFYANCFMMAILDQISKLFLLHQLQVLCDRCVQSRWFQSKQSWETFDHIHASPTAKCIIVNFYANCFMAAMLDWISKLLLVLQLQVLCDTCVKFHWFQSKHSWETFDHIHGSQSGDRWYTDRQTHLACRI